jgi:hypothetical protein
MKIEWEEMPDQDRDDGELYRYVAIIPNASFPKDPDMWASIAADDESAAGYCWHVSLTNNSIGLHEEIFSGGKAATVEQAKLAVRDSAIALLRSQTDRMVSQILEDM